MKKKKLEYTKEFFGALAFRRDGYTVLRAYLVVAVATAWAKIMYLIIVEL